MHIVTKFASFHYGRVITFLHIHRLWYLRLLKEAPWKSFDICSLLRSIHIQLRLKFCDYISAYLLLDTWRSLVLKKNLRNQRKITNNIRSIRNRWNRWKKLWRRAITVFIYLFIDAYNYWIPHINLKFWSVTLNSNFFFVL